MSSVKIKEIHLENYCGYRDVTFNFQDENGKIKPIAVFFGPNGCGKTTLLKAINILGNAKRFEPMELETLQLSFRKMTYHEDYDPTYAGFGKSKDPMVLTGTFIVDGEEKKVILHSTDGVVLNELPYKHTGHTYLINADSPMEMNKFQMLNEKCEIFTKIAKSVYDLDCELAKPIQENGGAIENVVDGWLGEQKINEKYIYTDFIINKNGSKIHFKSMSDGEKKIATLLRDLCNPLYIDDIDAVLVDNFELHIYWKRHAIFVDQILESFPDKQFFITTHSGILIQHIENRYSETWLYDISKYK